MMVVLDTLTKNMNSCFPRLLFFFSIFAQPNKNKKPATYQWPDITTLC